MLEKNPNLTPKEIKIRLIRSALDIGLDKNIQGYGEININRLLI